MGESQLALVAASPLPPPSPPAPDTSLSSGPWEPGGGPPQAGSLHPALAWLLQALHTGSRGVVEGKQSVLISW